MLLCSDLVNRLIRNHLRNNVTSFTHFFFFFLLLLTVDVVSFFLGLSSLNKDTQSHFQLMQELRGLQAVR